MAFKHLEILEAMVERAKVSYTPWDVVQWRAGEKWKSCTDFPQFHACNEYRIKPQPRVIDWSKVGKDVPVVFIWSDGATNTGFLHAYEPGAECPYARATAGKYSRASLESGKWVANVDGVNPWPPGTMVEVKLRGHKHKGAEKEAKEFFWMHGGCAADIIASRCVGLQEGWSYE
jgi:hypothetical protein